MARKNSDSSSLAEHNHLALHIIFSFFHPPKLQPLKRLLSWKSLSGKKPFLFVLRKNKYIYWSDLFVTDEAITYKWGTNIFNLTIDFTVSFWLYISFWKWGVEDYPSLALVQESMYILTDLFLVGDYRCTSNDKSGKRKSTNLHEDFADNDIIIIFKHSAKDNSNTVIFCLNIPAMKGLT